MEDVKENELSDKLISDPDRNKRSLPLKDLIIKKSHTNNIKIEQIINSEGTKNKNLEKIYTSRRNKSIEDTKIQKEKIAEWIEEDKKLLNFNLSLKEIGKFVSGDLEVMDINNEKRVKQVNEWVYINRKNPSSIRKDSIPENLSENNPNFLNISSSQCSTQNVILKNKIIRPETPFFNLRCLAMELEVNLLMAGESCFYIFSRGGESLSNEMAVCYINKELESSRKFINFAIVETSQHDENIFSLKTLKKQEIPKQENYIKNLDICEVKINFIDNGDNKCFVFIENDSLTQKQFMFTADFYIPTNQISNVMLASSGDLISLRSLAMKHINRNSRNNKDEELKTAQSCNCCNIY